MAEIIDHMRIFTRRSEGLPQEKVDVNCVVEDSLRLISQQLTTHNIELTKELDQDLPMVTGDPIRLEQVVMNLINNARNAVESSNNGPKTIQLKSYCQEHPQRNSGAPSVTIEVKNSGTGIPDDVIEKIFEPFFTTKEVGKGTGLGLSVSNKIIQKHSGSIEVESKPGKGTLFRIVLPTCQPEVDPEV